MSFLSACGSRSRTVIGAVSSYVRASVRHISSKEREAARRDTNNAKKLIRFKPKTPSLRHTVLVDHSHLYQGPPERSLIRGLRRHGGRSTITGHITVRHRGGGDKKMYRKIDFKRTILDVRANVIRTEYDPNRSSFIALIQYDDAEKTRAYIVAPDNCPDGTIIEASRTRTLDMTVGNAMLLQYMPIGAVFHCAELTPGRGAQLARGAGARCQLIDKDGKPGFALVELQSKEQRYIPLKCLATVGTVSNSVHHLEKLGKAGRWRRKGRRPRVRGMAMNPVDHPMGGGGGKAKGRHSMSPTNVLAKGFKTRAKRKPRDMIVVPRGGLRKGASLSAGGNK